jgi:hypothetical protein
MNYRDLWVLLLSVVCLCNARLAFAQVAWVGSVSNDATDPANWSTSTVPDGTSDVEFRGGDNGTIDVAGSPTWNSIFFNSAGPTTVNGSGTITLNGNAKENAIFSAGGPLDSTINPNIVSTNTKIQTNGLHNVTFNGSVSAAKIETFASTATYNGDVTSNNEFLTVGNVGKAVFNGNYHSAWENQSHIGINGGNSDITFTSLSSDFNPTGVNLINLYDSVTLRMSQSFVFGTESDIWLRRGAGVLDMQGFDESLEYIGTDAAGSGNTDVDTIMTIDFGASSGVNALTWQASHNMGGTYEVLNFEIGSDILELGAASPEFFSDDQLGRIKINGIPYSANDPGNGSAYWNRDELLQAQFFNVDAIDLTGDYNGDNKVDAADYTIWRNNLGSSFLLPHRGQGISGPVSNADYLAWKDNFGAGGGGGTIAIGVPEPASMLLVLFGLTLASCRRNSAIWRGNSAGKS